MSRKVVAGSGATDPKIPTLSSGLHQVYTPPGKGGKGKPGNKGGKGKSGSKGGKSRGYGAYGGYGGVDYDRAAALVKSMIRPELRGLRRERGQIGREVDSAIGRTNDLYSRSVGDLNHVFGESGDYINQRQQAIDAQYALNRDQSNAAQTALAAQLAANGQANMAGATDELTRLGLQGSGDLGGLLADQTFAQNTAAQTGANNMANLNAMDSNSDAIGNLLAGMNSGSKSSHLGQALNTRNMSIADLESERINGFKEVREAIRGLKGTRKDLMVQMLEQLSQSGWAQYMDQQQLNMQKRAARQSRSGGSGSGSYGSSGSGSTGGTSVGGGYYGAKVDAMIDALSGGAPGSGPKSPRPPKNKVPPIKKPFLPGQVLSGH